MIAFTEIIAGVGMMDGGGVRWINRLNGNVQINSKIYFAHAESGVPNN
jgi:hypothetical protein